jgi:hypothetical protein
MSRLPIYLLPALILTASCQAAEEPLSFRKDVLPVLSRAGCNAGSCHAKSGGQNGFALSIFTYDPLSDYREIVFNARGRRVFPAAPDNSLLLLKATETVPHEGGQRFAKDSAFYTLLHTWIAQGMPYTTPDEAELVRLDVEPAELSSKKGASHQLKVMAVYADNSRRDVTDMSEYTSENKDLVTVDHHGRFTVGNLPGRGVVIVRYLDKVSVSRIAIPPSKPLSKWSMRKLPINNPIDELAYTAHRELGLMPSPTCSDADFIRRATLDCLGKLPRPERVRAFLADQSADKREKLIDELLEDPGWADYWASRWGDMIRPNTQRVGVKPVYLLDRWLRRQLRRNAPYDDIVRGLLTATGSTHEHGPAVIFRDKREPETAGEFVSQIFLGIRIGCAKCHQHPSEKWGQTDYYQMAAFFAGMKSKGQKISAPISGEPEFIYFQPGGTVKHPVTDEVLHPVPPAGQPLEIADGSDPRAALVDWMVDPENPFFAPAMANRIWAAFLGRGIVHPVDDFRTSNPSVNDDMLDWLAADFVANDYDLKALMRVIMRSNIYQLSSTPNATNVADTRYFSRAYRRRLPAEVMLDAVSDLTGSPETLEGLPIASRAVQTWNGKMPSLFLDTFGRPDVSAECPCERDNASTVTQALHLMNSTTQQRKLSDSKGQIKVIADSDRSEAEIVEELYIAALSRPPTEAELCDALMAFEANDENRHLAAQDIAWALINSAEFVLNH